MLFHYIGADIFHLLSVILLLLRILKRKSCSGISAKCQLLQALAYTVKSLHTFASESYGFLFYHFASRLFFITFSYVLTLLVYFAFKDTREADKDMFCTEFLVMAAFGLALMYNLDMTPFNVTWVFGTYLEALAVIPQYIMIYTTKRMDSNMFFYVIGLIFYKLFYNFALVSLHCDKTIKVNISFGMVQLMLEGVVSICMMIAFCYRGINVYEEEAARMRARPRVCPYSKTCITPVGCSKLAETVASIRYGTRRDKVRLSCI